MVDISDMAREAALAIDNALPYLIWNKNDLKKLSWAIGPVKGFIWSKALLSAVKGQVIDDFMCCVRAAGYPKEEYSKLRRAFRFVYGATEVLPHRHWEISRTRIAISPLYEVAHLLERMAVFNTLESRFFRTPIDLAVLSITEATSIDSASAFRGGTCSTMETLLMMERDPVRGESNFRTRRQADIQSMISQLRADSLADTSFYNDWVARCNSL